MVKYQEACKDVLENYVQYQLHGFNDHIGIRNSGGFIEFFDIRTELLAKALPETEFSTPRKTVLG